MNDRSLALAALLVLSGFAPSADAGSVTYTGSFDTALTDVSGVPTSIAGVFTFTFDNSIVPSSGAAFFSITPDSLTMTPLGSTTFTPASVILGLQYFDGQFIAALLGGRPGGLDTVSSGTDDFLVAMYDTNLNSGMFQRAFATTTAASDVARSIPSVGGQFSGRIVAAANPEPSSLVLAALGAIWVAGYEWRRRLRSSAA
jgi:hypothetical protein